MFPIEIPAGKRHSRFRSLHEMAKKLTWGIELVRKLLGDIFSLSVNSEASRSIFGHFVQTFWTQSHKGLFPRDFETCFDTLQPV